MAKCFENAKFITGEYKNYFGSHFSPWGIRRPPLYQHTDIVYWEGLPMFAKDFEVDSAEKATLYFTALGCTDIFINGERIGTDEMKPGWSDYQKRALYCSYDVTAQVKPGKNRILAVVAPGWYSGRISGGRYGDASPAVMIALNVDGKEICTDSSWRFEVGGPIRMTDIWDGEYRDDTLNSYEEMSVASYGIKDWEKAEEYDFCGEVTPFIGTTIRIRDGLSLSPDSVTIFDGVEYNGSDYGKIHVCSSEKTYSFKLLRGQKAVVDFAQESVGFARITVKGEKGTTVKMRYAEFLNDSGLISRGNDGPEGGVYTINLRSALGKANYKIGEGSPSEFRPYFSFFGYRYVEISADGEIEILNISADVLGNDNTEIGKIETSDALVNKLISNTLWGQRSNYVSVPTDCPQRDERLGWTGDAQAFSVTAAYNADVYGFFRKWMQDMRDSQSEGGGYGDVNPRVGCCSSEDACAWADAGVIIPYNMYRMFGDTAIIEEHWDSMVKYVDGILEKYGLSGPIPRYGDWLAYDWCDNEFISSAYYVHDCDLMIYMGKAIGRDVTRFEKLREDAYGYFKDNYMADGKPSGTTQCEKIISLAFNLIPEEKTAEVAQELAQQIKENGDRLSCGFLGTYNLCPTLSKYGQDKTAYNLLMQRNEPSWLYSVDQGATTIWERWNSYTKENGFGDVGMNSFNHYAYGSIVEWMYRFMAGIEPIEPGFARFLLNPRIDLRKDDELPEGQKQMKWVKASYKSAAGLIESAWNTENGFTYTCSVPEGACAVLVLPALSDKLIINGTDSGIAAENGVFTAELLPGKYVCEQ